MSILQTETCSNLKDDTLQHIQQLVQINKDSAAGFQQAADAIEDKALAADFRVWAVDRTRQADDLASYVAASGGDVPEDESWLATLHQTWLKLRAAISSGDAYTVLAEAERGEDQIKEKYEEVLKETAGSPLNDVLQKQYVQVKSVHDRVRDLRDARKSSK